MKPLAAVTLMVSHLKRTLVHKQWLAYQQWLAI